MKTLVLRELKLLSLREKRAKTIAFHPSQNLLIGDNETGKSSILKSIYWALGADPLMSDRWGQAHVSTAIEVSVSEVTYTVLRDGNTFCVFDSDSKPLFSCSGVAAFAPFLSRLLDVNLYLPDRNGKLSSVPPAYLFLPFYVDQDRSWVHTWTSFSRLGQFPEYKRSLSDFHSGIRPSDYYVLVAQRDMAVRRLAEVQARIDAMAAVRQRVEQALGNDLFSLTVSDFKNEINALVEECAGLRDAEEEYKTRVIELRNHRIEIDQQIAIAVRVSDELASDMSFATKANGDHLECPTCGAEYHNSFAQRFKLAQDRNRCRELAVELRQERAGLDDELLVVEGKLMRAAEEAGELERLLKFRRDGVGLDDVIRDAGRKEMKKVVLDSLTDLYQEASRAKDDVTDIKKKLSDADSPVRRKQIRQAWFARMRLTLKTLEVHEARQFSDEMWSDLSGMSGSQRARAMMAFYYCFLHVAIEFGSRLMCPIIIDTPNQQGQTTERLQTIIEFILSDQPKGSQLLLGLEGLHDVKYDGYRIELDTRNRLLDSQAFKEQQDWFLARLESATILNSDGTFQV